MIQNFNSNLAASGVITAPSGLFDLSLTISGTPVFHQLPPEISVGEITAVTGTFTTELTVSGIPVDIGGGPDPLNIGTINVSSSLTVSGIPVDTTGGGGGGTALTVKEIDGVPSVANVDTIVVSNDTLTDDGGGQVTIQTGAGGATSSGTATTSGCYAHVQSSSSASWTIPHNLDTIKVNYIVLDDIGGQVMPDLFTIDSADQVTIDFINPRTGIANIFACIEDVAFADAVFDSITAVTGTFTEGLTIGTGTIDIHPERITAPEGRFIDILTVSGIPVDIGGGGGGGGGSTLVTSGTWFNVEAKPANPHPRSDWFDDNSTNPDGLGNHAIDYTKWTLWDEDAVSGTGQTGFTSTDHDGDGTTLDGNQMQIAHDGTTLDGWVGFYQDAPTPDDYTITCRLGADAIFSSTSNYRFGIFVADDLDGAPATSDLYSMHIHHIVGAVPTGDYSQWECSLWTQYNSISTTVNTAASPYPGTDAWVRIRVSGLFAECDFSHDGIHWKELARQATLGFTPSHIGFGMQKGAAGQHNVMFDFFVVASGAHRGGAAGYGRHIPVIIGIN